MVGIGRRSLTRLMWDRVWILRRPKLLLDWYRLWSTWPVASWIRAAHCFQDGDFRQALNFYRQGLAEHPTHRAAPCAKLDIAYCYYRLDELETATEELQDLIHSGAQLKDAYLLLAKIQALLGLPLSAGSTMFRCLEMFPNDVQALVAYVHLGLWVGLPHESLIDAKDALISLKRGLMLDDSRQVGIDSAIAHCEIRGGDIELGDRVLARALATGRAPYEAVLLRGERLLEQQRIIPAREQLTRAMGLMPRSSRAARLLAESYLIEGIFFEPEWAKQLATSACKASHWQDVRCIEVLIRAYEACGETGAAQLFSQRIPSLASFREMERLRNVGGSRRRSGPQKVPSAS